MAVQLNKVRPDEPSGNGAVEVYAPLSFPLVNVEELESFSITQTQLGGSFNFTVIGERPSLENVFGTIFKTFAGVVEKSGVDISSSGINTVHEGRLSGISYKSYDNVSFSNSTPFVKPSGQIVPEPLLPSFDNHYRFLNLTASQVITILCQRAGYALRGINLPIDYPVWRYEVIGGVTLESINEVAKAGGANAILRDNGVWVIPYGSSLGTVVYEFEDLLDNIRVRSEKTEFSQVVVQPSTDITPWNSTYEGTPEQLGTVEFKAGVINTADASSVTQIQKSDDWTYPKEGTNNQWIRYTGEARYFKSSISQNFNEVALWDARPHSEGRVTFGSFGTFYAGASTKLYEEEEITPTSPGNIDVDVLYSWGTASKKFQSQGDILDELIVVPDEQSAFNNTFGVNCGDLYTTQLLGYGLGSIPSSVGSWQVGDLDFLPTRFYTCDVYKDDACTDKGFAADGSFYIGLRPHNVPKLAVVGLNPQPVYDASNTPNSYLELDSGYTVDVQKASDTSQYPIASVGSSPDPLVTVSTKKVEVQDNAVIVYYKRGQMTDAVKQERLTKLTVLRDLLARSKYDGIKLNNHDRQFEVTGSVLIDTEDDQELKLKVITGILPNDQNFVNERFKLVKLYNIGDHLIFTNTSAVATIVSSGTSGTPSQQVQEINGKWTLYKLPRRTYTPTIVTDVSTVTATAYYNETIPTGNSKTVSSSLITDHTTPGSHAMDLSRLLAQYLRGSFYSFQASVVYNGGNMPQIGDRVIVRNVPVFGDVASVCTESSLSGDSGGVTVRVSCGRFDII